MSMRLLVLLVLLGVIDTPLAAAQASRVPARPPAGNPDVSDFANPQSMQMLMTGALDELAKIGRSNAERSRIRGYLYGLFEVVGPYASSPSSRGARAPQGCGEISAAVGEELVYLRGWIRDYVAAYQLNLLKSATLPGVLGPAGVTNAVGAFADMQDIIQDGKTDGERLVKTLTACNAPGLKAIVASARRIRNEYPSSADPYVATMPTAADLQALAGVYAVERSTSVTGNVTVKVSGSNLTLTDSRGRNFELRPEGDNSFVIAGSSQGRVTFNPLRKALAFRQSDDVMFMATRVEGAAAELSAHPYQILAGPYTVISNIPRNLPISISVSSASTLTVAVNGSRLTLTDSQGRSYELRPTGKTDEFAVTGIPQALILIRPIGTLSYREGRARFGASRERTSDRR